MVIFGGFYEITKELSDMYLFDFKSETWIKILEETDSAASLLRLGAGPSSLVSSKYPVTFQDE